jgi:hypothetical protein
VYSAADATLPLQKMLKHLQDEGTTRSRIAETLSISRSELDQLMFGLAMVGIEGGRRDNSKASGKNSRTNLKIVEPRS